MHQIIDYDYSTYDFRQWAKTSLGTDDLSKIHLSEKISKFNTGPVTNQLTEKFTEIEAIYNNFIKDIISPIFNGINSYQSPPSFRFHYKNYKSSVFHRDRDFGVTTGRYNIWVPLTNVWGDNSLWIESEEGLNDCSPAKLNYGQALIFDGVNLHHGSKLNTTNSTRVSFDLRVLPGSGPPKPSSY
tara:strand:+ start:51 stop:605 length:555 start_codon:yes stop_codon:yes gene_type:complete